MDDVVQPYKIINMDMLTWERYGTFVDKHPGAHTDETGIASARMVDRYLYDNFSLKYIDNTTRYEVHDEKKYLEFMLKFG